METSMTRYTSKTGPRDVSMKTQETISRLHSRRRECEHGDGKQDGERKGIHEQPREDAED